MAKFIVLGTPKACTEISRGCARFLACTTGIPYTGGALADERLNELEECLGRLSYPLLRGGRAAPINQLARYLKFDAAGEVKLLLKQDSDLPRCALFKVARHLFVGRSDPSSKEGIIERS